MKIEKIKPIPKYIIEKIKKLDNKLYPSPKGNTRYYAYLTKNDGELVKVTVAVRHYHKARWLYKQVAVHGIHSKKCFVKDMVYFYIGGYITGWYEQGLTQYRKWYEDPEWGWSEDKYFNPYATVVNKEYIGKFPEYKYSAFEFCNSIEIIKYLRIYEKYPQTEYLLKAGLEKIADSKQILEKVSKNKAFRKFLYKNAKEIRTYRYYIGTILQAFKKNKSLSEIQAYEEAKKSLTTYHGYSLINEVFNGNYTKYFEYIGSQCISNSLYIDYLRACKYLNIDMSIDKNRFPHDFRKWHDIRIDEYHTKIAEEDKKAKQELYNKFALVSEKYMPLQKESKGIFICMIAKSPQDLIQEGQALHHCVGRMNYDQKFTREETLIFFIRNKETPNTPLVTVEYSIKKKQILQCYAEHNTTPSEDIQNYIYKKWLPYANRQLKRCDTANKKEIVTA